MAKHSSRKWWQFYLLFPLAVGLLLLDADAPISATWQQIFLVAIVVVICGLALAWVEANPRVIENEGVDAKVVWRAYLPDLVLNAIPEVMPPEDETPSNEAPGALPERVAVVEA